MRPPKYELGETPRQRQVGRSAYAGVDEPQRQREFIVDEIGERPACDRFDRIAEQHVAGVAVTPLLARRKIKRCRVERLHDLLTRERLAWVKSVPKLEPVMTK